MALLYSICAVGGDNPAKCIKICVHRNSQVEGRRKSTYCIQLQGKVCGHFGFQSGQLTY